MSLPHPSLSASIPSSLSLGGLLLVDLLRLSDLQGTVGSNSLP